MCVGLYITAQLLCFSFKFVQLGIVYYVQKRDYDKLEPILLRIEWYASKIDGDYFPNEMQTCIIRTTQDCKPCTHTGF